MTTVDLTVGALTTKTFAEKVSRGSTYPLHAVQTAKGYWSGAQDTAQNTYTVGDLVYVVSGVANRIYANSAQGTVATGSIGVLVDIYQPAVNGQERHMDAVTFTAAGEVDRCVFTILGAGTQLDGNLLKIGDSTTHAPIALVWTTHCAANTTVLYAKLSLRNSTTFTVEVV